MTPSLCETTLGFPGHGLLALPFPPISHSVPSTAPRACSAPLCPCGSLGQLSPPLGQAQGLPPSALAAFCPQSPVSRCLCTCLSLPGGGWGVALSLGPQLAPPLRPCRRPPAPSPATPTLPSPCLAFLITLELPHLVTVGCRLSTSSPGEQSRRTSSLRAPFLCLQRSQVHSRRFLKR